MSDHTQVLETCQISIFTHYVTVGKHYALEPLLVKHTNGVLITAQVKTVTLNHIHELVNLFETSTGYQHLVSGLSGHDEVTCLPANNILPGTVSRDNKCFTHPKGVGGILIFDSDGIDGSPRQQFIDAVPDIANYACVETSSSSSNIYGDEPFKLGGGLCYKGWNSSHTIYHIKDLSDTARALDVMHKRLMIAKHSNSKVSGAGGFLERSAVDTMLSSPSQPLYMKANLGVGLEQRKHIKCFDGIAVIDTKLVIPDLTPAEEVAYENEVMLVKFYLGDEMKRVREVWIIKQPSRVSAVKALDEQVLDGDFLIHTIQGDMTVGELLADPTKWHGVTCKDPFEPDYSGSTVAKIYCNQDRGYIYSQAHGGIKYRILDAANVGFGATRVPVAEALGSVGSDITSVTIDASSGGVVRDAPVASYEALEKLPSLEWHGEHVSSKGKPVSMSFNFERMLYVYGIRVGYDVIAKDVMITGQGMVQGSDLSSGANYARIFDLCMINDFKTSTIDNHMQGLMIKNECNPVEEWITSVVWDGIDRIDVLFNTLTLHEDQNRDLAYMLFRKWLSGASKIVQNKIDHFEFVLVLQDVKGGKGKTAWFNKLCPRHWRKDGVSLDPTDKDSIKQAIGYWLVELGELDSLFRKADVKRLMAFLSNETDEIRLPYAKQYNKYKRRTAFFGSVNKREFLVDDSGDRRFWGIAITDINYEHNVDMQQLWAQVNHLDERHWLNSEENDLVIQSNKTFKSTDVIDDKMDALFSRPRIGENETEHLSVSAILNKAGMMNICNRDLHKAKSWLQEHDYKEFRLKGVRGFYIPKLAIFV